MTGHCYDSWGRRSLLFEKPLHEWRSCDKNVHTQSRQEQTLTWICVNVAMQTLAVYLFQGEYWTITTIPNTI